MHLPTSSNSPLCPPTWSPAWPHPEVCGAGAQLPQRAGTRGCSLQGWCGCARDDQTLALALALGTGLQPHIITPSPGRPRRRQVQETRQGPPRALGTVVHRAQPLMWAAGSTFPSLGHCHMGWGGVRVPRSECPSGGGARVPAISRGLRGQESPLRMAQRNTSPS